MNESRIMVFSAVIATIIAGASIIQSFYATALLSNEIEALRTEIESLTERLELIEDTIGLHELVKEKQLIEAAKAEGKVVLYCTMDPEYKEPFAAAFNAKYPFIKLEVWEGDSSEILEKFRAELASGNRIGDLMLCIDTATMEIIREEGSLEYEKLDLPPGTLDGYGPGMIDSVYPDDPETVTAQLIGPCVIFYNTELVKPEDVPKSYQDLLDPKWKGQKICIEDRLRRGGGGTNDWMIAMLEKGILTVDYFRELAKQEPVFQRGHTAAARLLAAGEFPILLNYFAYKIDMFEAKDAPIDWVRMEGVPRFTSSNSIAIIKNAPHPNAAKLFARWILSTEGQRALRDAGMIPARIDILPLNRELGGVDLFVLKKEWAEKREEYTEVMAEIFGS